MPEADIQLSHTPPRPGTAELSRATPDHPRLQLHRPQPQRDVPYVPTDEAVVESMLDMASVGPGDVVYDLGCGDGRIVIAAARRGARGVGVDIDLQRIKECYWNARRAGVGGERARFIRASLFDIDFSDATVLTLYLLTGINVKLRPKILWELKPGSRVVSNFFDMGDWKPDERADVHKRTLYRWTVPAWIEGEWHCYRDAGNRGAPSELRATRHAGHMLLQLHRRYQHVRGTARIGRREFPLEGARLDGDRLRFSVRDPSRDGATFCYECRHAGGALRGTCRPLGADEDRAVAWGAVRR